MIKANELRIGNWVEIDYCYRQVTSISEEGINIAIYDDCVIWEDKIRGIPLTPDIFEKAGFEDILGDRIWSKDGIELFHGSRFIEERDGYWACAYWQPTESETETKLQYIHQLQNLYFALTGEELDITF
jgi:hypothetical protein